MISAHERADLIHILKMNHFTLAAEDGSQLLFAKETDDNLTTSVIINSRENLLVIQIERAGTITFSGTFKSINDLKIFLEGEASQHYLN